MENQQQEAEGATPEASQENGVAGKTARPGAVAMLSAREWEKMVRALPPLVRSRARRGIKTRRFVEAVLWVATNGAYWSCLPAAYGASHSVYVRFTRWALDGHWTPVAESLRSRHDLAGPLLILVENYLKFRNAQQAKKRMQAP